MINHYGDGIKHAGQLKKTMSVHGSHLEQEMKLTNFDITDHATRGSSFEYPILVQKTYI